MNNETTSYVRCSEWETSGKNHSERGEINFPNNKMMATALEYSKVGLWAWDMVNNHVYWSHNVYYVFGLSPETFEGSFEPYSKLIYPNDLSFIQERIGNAMETDRTILRFSK